MIWIYNFKCQINMLFIFSFVINNWYNRRKHNYCYNFCRWTWTNWEVSYLSLVEKRCEKYHQRLKFNFYAHCGKKRIHAWFLILLWMRKRNRMAKSMLSTFIFLLSGGMSNCRVQDCPVAKTKIKNQVEKVVVKFFENQKDRSAKRDIFSPQCCVCLRQCD